MFAGFGVGGSFGVKAAVDDINKLGGVYVEEFGRRIPIKLIVADSESDPIKTGTLAEDMALRDKVNFFIPNTEPPPMRAPIATVADRYKIPQIVGTVLEPWLGMREAVDPPWQYTWTTGFAIVVPPNDPEDFRSKPGYTIVDTWMAMLAMFGDQTNKKVGVFASFEPDGIGWYSLFPPSLKDLGYEPIGIDKELGLLPLETTDFSAVIKEWQDNDVEILWGNAPAPFWGTMWRQAKQMGFEPKMVAAGRAALFYSDVVAWGGDLPLSVGIEIWWDPTFKDSPGIGDTTPQSLADRWTAATGEPLNPNIGWSYTHVQILVDAIERAGTLDPDAVNTAIGETDMLTMIHRVKFEEGTQMSRMPLVFGQWFKTDTPEQWELKIVFSEHDFIDVAADPVFPVLYD